MNKSTSYLVAICLFFSPVLTCGQQLSSTILQHFTPSVISKVYSVSKQLKLETDKQLELAKAYAVTDSLICIALNTGKTEVDIKNASSEFKLVCLYDSLVEQRKQESKALTYLNAKIGNTNKNVDLTASQRQRITNLFLLNCKYPDCSFGDALLLSLQKVVNDTAFYTAFYKTEINQKAMNATTAYPQKNEFPTTILNDCRDIVFKFQQSLIAIDYAYPTASAVKTGLIENVKSHFQPLIDSVLIKKGYYYPDNVFSKAVRLQKILKLSNDQVDKLNVKSTELTKLTKENSRKNPYADFDASYYSRTNLKNILTDDQYRTIIQLRMQKRAEQASADMWKDMVKYGFSTMNDSVATTKKVYFYNLERLVVEDIYQDQPSIINAKLRDVDILIMPEEVKQYNKAKREAKNKASLSIPVKTKFEW